MKRVLTQVPLSQITKASHNPVNRTSPARIKRLVKSMGQLGQLLPILLDKDKTVIDGHRRLAAAHKLKWPRIEAIINGDGDSDKIYAQINTDTVCKMTGNDALGVWLKNPGAVTPHTKKVFETMEVAIGLPLIREMYRMGLSSKTYRQAVQLANYCGVSLEVVPSIIQWMMKFNLSYQIRKAMEMGESPKLLLKSIQQMKPIKMKLQLA